jgi:hypothetical protein
MWGRLADTSNKVQRLGTSGKHPEDLVAEAAISVLRTAAALARSGDRAQARELSVSVLFEVQPIIRSHPELMRALLYALLMGHGFKLISRLCQALGVRPIHVELLRGQNGQIVPPCCYDDTEYTTCKIDSRWMTTLAADDVLISRWCEALISGPAVASVVEKQRPAPVTTEAV